MDRMRKRARGRGRVRDRVCVRVDVRLSAWKVMDEGETGASSKSLINLLCFEEEIVEGVHVDIASSGSSSQKTRPLPEIIDNEIIMTL